MCQNHNNHNHEHPHTHNHEHYDAGTCISTLNEISAIKENERRIISSGTDILHENDIFSERIKGYLDAINVFSINMMSSPGSGKTTILENTIKRLSERVKISVIEGDQYTENDAQRIKALDIPAIQINTGNGCHLESFSVYDAIKKIELSNPGMLFIENVGNLVCPALFNIGEDIKAVVISTTEGVDKPLKYPAVFALSDVCIINKTDLLPYLNIEIDELERNIRSINNKMKIFRISCVNGEGFDNWCDFLINCKK